MENKLNRRKFLELSALAGAGISLGGIFGLKPAQLAAMSVSMESAEISFGLAPIAIVEDCARLVIHSRDFSDQIKTAITRQWEDMQAAGSFKSAEKHLFQLIDSGKKALKADELDEFNEKKMALTISLLPTSPIKPSFPYLPSRTLPAIWLNSALISS